MKPAELNAIIHPVEKDYRTASHEIAVALEPRTGEVTVHSLAEGRISARVREFFGGQPASIIVVAFSDAVPVLAQLEQEVVCEDFETAWRLPVSIRCQVEAVGAPSERPVVALSIVRSLQAEGRFVPETLRYTVAAAFAAFIREKGEIYFIRHFESEQKRLCAHIRRVIETTHHLRSNVTARVSDSEQVENPMPFESEVTDQLKDYRLSATITVEARTTVENWGLAVALRLIADTMKSEFITKAREFLAEQRLHDLYESTTSAEAKLTARLSEIAKLHGRTVSNVRIRWTPPVPKSELEANQVFQETLSYAKKVYYPEDVNVDCRLVLELRDIGRYLSSGETVLEEWAHRTCNDIILRELLNVDYGRLLIQELGTFEAFDNNIIKCQKQIEAAADRIGFACTASLRTNLQFDEIRHQFNVQILEEPFDTQDSRQSVKLSIEVSARIRDVAAIQGLYKKSPNLKQTIREAIIALVSARMRLYDDQSWARQFIDPPHRDEFTMEQELEHGLEVLLSNEPFSAEYVAVSCRWVRPPFLDVYETLNLHDQTLEWNVLSTDRETVGLQIGYRVSSQFGGFRMFAGAFLRTRVLIDNPERLRTEVFKQVKELVYSAGLRVLGTMGLDELLSSTDLQLQSRIEENICEAVKNKLGLVLDVRSFRRSNFGEEDEFTKQRRARRIATIQGIAEFESERLARMDERLKNLWELEDDAIRVMDDDRLQFIRRELESALRQREELSVALDTTVRRHGFTLPQLSSLAQVDSNQRDNLLTAGKNENTDSPSTIDTSALPAE